MEVKNLYKNKQFLNALKQMQSVCNVRKIDLYLDWEWRICFEQRTLLNNK